MDDRTSENPKVSEIVLNADGIVLSALLAEPPHDPAKAVVVALHGAGMRAGYFHGQAHPEQSLLSLGAKLGFAVLSVDRPGYGLSAARLPKGQGLTEQSATLRAALADYAGRYSLGAGMFLLAHSYGGKLALAAAADTHDDLLGLDLSGVGHRYAVDERLVTTSASRANWATHWGPLRLYPQGTFRSAAPLISEVPAREREEAWDWPDRFPGIAARVRLPVRFTYAEHERWWCHDEASVATMTGLLASPRVTVDRLSHAGHNISLGLAARTYHLRALAFFEECLTERTTLPDRGLISSHTSQEIE
ncbi:alpha/beta hydrolase [Streptosporangium sp. NPDC001559]|uniref:alpha/beta hydrolase n=1 Tax=Streptosporangium sp. NPDC001559 TaxID=3366187 RepID=UPI0036E29634